MSQPLMDYFIQAKTQHARLALQLESMSPQDSEVKKVGKQYSELSRLVHLIEQRDELRKVLDGLDVLEAEELSNGMKDNELLSLIDAERKPNIEKLRECEESIVRQMVPKDEDDDKGVVLEVRSGTGGDEASLFAGEIFKMYQKLCEFKRWKWELISISKTEVGGFKEAQASINGLNIYKHLKYESGVHRVQRIPSNDTRIQTSAASVIVMPEAEELDVNIKPQDLRIDVFRSQGAGGQSVNKTESAVRITHIPTGCVVSMQDERSQIQNRQKAMQILRTRVYNLEKKKLVSARSELRSLAHGTGDRADKIRTYNFPQDRVTDHRIGFSIQGVDRVLAGITLDHFLEQLLDIDEKQKLENFLNQLNSTDSYKK